jgi:hypothetical protein
VALDSRGSAVPGRLRAPTGARTGTRAPAAPVRERLLRGVAWGLVFAVPVWLLLVALLVWWLRGH